LYPVYVGALLRGIAFVYPSGELVQKGLISDNG